MFEKVLGRWRLWWKLCPACNCDAPKCDHCRVCEGFRGVAHKERLVVWRRRWLSQIAMCQMIDAGNFLTVKDAREMRDYFDSYANFVETIEK